MFILLKSHITEFLYITSIIYFAIIKLLLIFSLSFAYSNIIKKNRFFFNTHTSYITIFSLIVAFFLRNELNYY